MTAPTLVTGAAGFAGSHLVEHLLAHGTSVAAWAGPSGEPLPRASSSTVPWRRLDLLDREAVARAIAELRPSAIYHCAGDANAAASWKDPARPLRVNALGTHHLLDAVRRAALTCPILVTGSATVYRASPDAMREDAPIGPASPYGLSKLAQEMVAMAPGPGRVVVTRPFNHAGPRQTADYVTSAFAKQIAEIEAGRAAPVLRVGNLDARRDLSDVRDVVRAYRLLLLHGRDRSPYNVCSGQAYRIGDLLDILLSLARTPVRIEQDPARLRAADVPVVLGDAGALHKDTGWRTEIDIRDTLRDLLDDWRGAIARV